MNLVLKLLSSPWFWLDIFLSISGGIIVWWGLRVEKKAENLLPPEDFKPDLFDDKPTNNKTLSFVLEENDYLDKVMGYILELVCYT